MQKTEHYGLNLWELSDRIQMEDFNRDNTKLDAALAALAAGSGTRFEVLNENTTYPTPMSMVNNSFWGFDDPTQWDKTSLIFITGSLTKPKDGAILFLRLSTSAAPVPASKVIADLAMQPGGFLCILTPLKDPSRNVQGIFLSNGEVKPFYTDYIFSQCTVWSANCTTSSGTISSATFANLSAFAVY